MIRRAGCAELAELRSAFVDSALGDRDRERLLSHLVGCISCRADVEDLRRVRQLLATPERSVDAPDNLSSRLISIAESTAPKRPRRVSRHLLAAGTALVVVIASLATVGFVAAPPVTSAVSGDPRAEALDEFGGMLASLPLTSQSIDALAALQPTQTGVAPTPQTVGWSGVARELSPTEARRRLEAAARAPRRISFSGKQNYRAIRNDIQIAATVDVVNVAGRGTEMTVSDPQGREVQSRFVRDNAASRLDELTLVGLLSQNYGLSGWPGSEVAGRRATVIEARAGEQLAARWWVDDGTALVLWQETYGPEARVQSSVGYTDVSFGAEQLRSLPPQRGTSRTTTSLTLAATGDLAAQGWTPPRTLAGLPLVKLRSDRARDPQALHLVYSDGLSVVSVFEQRGGLRAGPAGTRWDDRLSAHVRWGSASTASWQSAGTVLTVVSNGSPDLVGAAVAALPHEPVSQRSTMECVLAGWGHILGLT